MRFLDILVVLKLDLGQISFNLVENAFAAQQLALLATRIALYDILAPVCAEIKKVLDEKVTYVFRRFDFWIFSPFLSLLFFSFCCSDWPSTGLACGSKTSKKESLRRPIFTMEQLGVVAGNFALRFSLIFLCIFVHISGSLRPITLIQASLERSFPPADLFRYRWCQFWSKVMTSERRKEEKERTVKARHGRLRAAQESMD